jgi:outer membrane protein OmpA-like peptidoglycan-associated protein
MTTLFRPLIALFAALLLLAGCATPRVASGFTAQQVAILEAQGFVPSAEGYQLTIADRLLFASDSSALGSEQAARLTQTATALMAVGINGARVDGHTDDTGAADYNLRLSLARAQSVATALVGGGFPAINVSQRGLGESMPTSDNATPEGRAQNRRVSIIVSTP